MDGDDVELPPQWIVDALTVIRCGMKKGLVARLAVVLEGVEEFRFPGLFTAEDLDLERAVSKKPCSNF